MKNISNKKREKPTEEFGWFHTNKLTKITNISSTSAVEEKLIADESCTNNCKETVLCYNLSDIIVVDDNLRYFMTSTSVSKGPDALDKF